MLKKNVLFIFMKKCFNIGQGINIYFTVQENIITFESNKLKIIIIFVKNKNN